MVVVVVFERGKEGEYGVFALVWIEFLSKLILILIGNCHHYLVIC